MISGLKRPSLITNAASNWLAMGVSMVVGFILQPYLIEYLGTDKYGTWILIVSVVGYSGLLDLGITSATMRHVARYVGQRDSKLLNETINTSLIMFCLVGLVVVIVSLFAAAPLANFFHIKPEDVDSFKKAIWLIGLSAGLMFPDRVLAVVILAHERFVIGNAVKIANIILKGVLSILVLFAGGKLIGLSLVFALLGLLSLGVRFAVLKVFFKHIEFRFSAVSKLSAWALMSFGFFSLLAQLGVFLSTQLGPAIVGRFCEKRMVGVYGVAVMAIGYLSHLVISCVGVTQPRLAALAGTVDKKEFVDSLMRYSVLISNLTVCAGLVAYLVAREFFQLWLPDLKGTYLVFWILLLSQVPTLMVNILVNALQAINKHACYAYQTIGEGVVSLILSVILVKRYGVVGVAIGATVPSLLAKVVLQPLYCSYFIHFNWVKYMFQVVIKPLALAGIVITISKVSIYDLNATSYVRLIPKAMAVALAYALPAYWFCIDENTRQVIVAKIRRFLSGRPFFLPKQMEKE
ncbi:MAG: lipopolysaccharide biosynthesis protein [Planctomycetota bacterium]|jgi:O-antigen/teichoic acid export membrane protein